jgi:hypothetical protein
MCLTELFQHGVLSNMAFALAGLTETLTFENVDLNEMYVQVKSDVSLKTFFDLQLMMGTQDPQKMMEACILFGDEVLQDWSVTRDEKKIPADGEGFLSLPMTLAMEVIKAWTDTVATAGEALSPSLNGGSP